MKTDELHDAVRPRIFARNKKYGSFSQKLSQPNPQIPN
jgi:hypothetical protein